MQWLVTYQNDPAVLPPQILKNTSKFHEFQGIAQQAKYSLQRRAHAGGWGEAKSICKAKAFHYAQYNWSSSCSIFSDTCKGHVSPIRLEELHQYSSFKSRGCGGSCTLLLCDTESRPVGVGIKISVHPMLEPAES